MFVDKLRKSFDFLNIINTSILLIFAIGLDNCLIVPHIASASYKTRYEMSKISAENLINGVNKKSLITCVNPEVNY